MSDRLFVGNFEHRKLKRKIDELSAMNTDSKSFLSLSLGGKNMVHGSSSMSTLKSLNHKDLGLAPKPVENSNDKQVVKPKEEQFSCKFCDKKFLSPQALGGHQNAHKRQRILSRVDKEFAMSDFGLGSHLCPCSTMANCLPFHGTPLHHRAHMHSMALMSTMPWHCFGLDYGNQGFYKTSFPDHQFGMMSNSCGTGVEAPKRLNFRNMGCGCELDQVPSLAGNVVNGASIAHGVLENLQ